MLFLIEGLGFEYLAYSLSKYGGRKSALAVFSAIFATASVLDPILYNMGFIWTASTLMQSLFINGIVYAFALSGIVLQSWKSLNY